MSRVALKTPVPFAEAPTLPRASISLPARSGGYRSSTKQRIANVTSAQSVLSGRPT